MVAKTFEDLIVWQKAHRLVLNIYKYSQDFPKIETYGLTSQLRRAAVSIPANIAEGFNKRGKADKARFMNIAQASLAEVKYYLILAEDLHYANTKELMPTADEVGKLLAGYTKSILSSIRI